MFMLLLVPLFLHDLYVKLFSLYLLPINVDKFIAFVHQLSIQ